MPKNFLMIDKDLFKLDLTPIQLLILAQVMEFDRNTGDCFISNERMAKQFGVSEATVRNQIDKLVKEKKYIIRDTKNTQKGKERHMLINWAQVDADIDRANCV